MQHSMMQTWIESSHLDGGNMAYIEALYDAYLDDPSSVSEQWRSFFDRLPALPQGSHETKHSTVQVEFRRLAKEKDQLFQRISHDTGQDAKQVRVLQLINAFRFRGHQHAQLDPLGIWKQPYVSELSTEHHELTANDLNRKFNVGSFAVGDDTMVLRDLVKALERTYCSSVGAEYMHITSTEEKRWIQSRLESIQSTPRFDQETQLAIYKGLVAADGFEKYLAARFPGAKRFSLEGGDSLIPMLKTIIHRSGEQGQKEVVIGMAHRGRLNVLVNVLGKNPAELFDEFSGKHDEHLTSGDVKYHQGFSSDFATKAGNVHLALAFNPSHLEIVNPVVIGSVRARLDRRNCTTGSKALPITIHGDAAIAGQGVVQETFNLSQTRAYKVGGTIRIVINNQIGFTTSRHEDSRSTQYCTDIAKMVQAPILHVNADDPEAVMMIAELAVDYRNTFKRDVVIDLVCYRRHGHNEADEPAATQPIMYQAIKAHLVPRAIYAQQLAKKGFDAQQLQQHVTDYRQALDSSRCVVDEWRPMREHSVDWTPYLGHDWTVAYKSHLHLEQLKTLGQKMTAIPEEVGVHPRVKRIYDDRQRMISGEKLIDWGCAELLAYTSLLDTGIDIRITGQDCGRGTFFHRHSVIHNQKDGSNYLPLQHLSEHQGKFEIYDSVLSEEAVLAFEYGYATAEPTSLVIWEAQFGDFANGAQVVIDQFLSSGEEKWGRLCGLTLLLPHGYEGQGPEHSSARLERFLQLCANHNMQIVTPTTPAQIYNLIRRQSIRPMRRPLIVMSPKSLLRHPMAVSKMDELATGVFHNVITEVDDLDSQKVQRVVLCGGKVYYDLLDHRRKHDLHQVAIIRIEQLYPFPHQELADVLTQYSHVTDFVWCQEEPQNQGAWYCSQHHFYQAIPKGARLTFAGRQPSPAPAVGYNAVHLKEQKQVIEDALILTSQK